MPDFLKRILLLIAVNMTGFRVLSLNMHDLKAFLIIAAVLAVANPAIWRWEFE